MMLSGSVLLLLAGMNAIVCVDILFHLFKHSTPGTRHVYTYQDSDYPMIPPGLTSSGPRLVAATFSESSRYTFLNSSDPLTAQSPAHPWLQSRTPDTGHSHSHSPPASGSESESIWDTLYNPHYGSGYYYLGPRQNRVLTRAYHAMHCVRMLTKELDAPAHASNPSAHFQHCLFYLREVFLCAADHTLEEGDFMKRNYMVDRVGETRVCRDWTFMDEWLDVEFAAWLVRNGLSLEDVDGVHT